MFFLMKPVDFSCLLLFLVISIEASLLNNCQLLIQTMHIFLHDAIDEINEQILFLKGNFECHIFGVNFEIQIFATKNEHFVKMDGHWNNP